MAGGKRVEFTEVASNCRNTTKHHVIVSFVFHGKMNENLK